MTEVGAVAWATHLRGEINNRLNTYEQFSGTQSQDLPGDVLHRVEGDIDLFFGS